MTNPFDGFTSYELAHLAFHLAEAREDEQLHQLLGWSCDGERGERRNAWFEAKDAVGDVAGYLLDIDLAWRAADLAFATPGRRASAVSLQLRYALVISSVRSRAAVLRPELLAAFVHQGVWSTAKALAYATQLPSSATRAEALTTLAARAADSNSVEAVRAAALELDSADERAEVLTALVRAAPGPARTLVSDLLEQVPHLTGENCVQALAVVVPQLDDAQRGTALTAAAAITDGSARAAALIVMADGLDAEQARLALRAAVEIDEAVGRAQVVATLAARLDPAERGHVLGREQARARGLESTEERAHALAALGQVAEALRDAETITDRDTHALTIAQLAPFLTTNQVTRALRGVNDISSAGGRATALASLAPYLPPSSMLTAIQVATSARSHAARADALEALAAHLPNLRLHRVLNEALRLKNVTLRARIIAALAPRLPEQLLDIVLKRAARQTRGGGRGALLAAIGPYLSERQHELAVSMVERMSDPADRMTALEALATTLSGEVLSRAVTALPGLGDADENGETFAVLASFLSDEWLDEALSAVERMSPQARPGALDMLAPRLVEAGRTDDLSGAIWRHVDSVRPVPGACDLALLATHLPAGPRAAAQEQVCATLETYATWSMYFDTWLDAAEHLASRTRQKALRRALSLARQTSVVHDTSSAEQTEQMFRQSEAARERAIARVAMATARIGRPADALPVARSLKIAAWRAEALGSIVPWVAVEQRDAVAREALNAALRASQQASYWIDDSNWIGIGGLAGIGGNVSAGTIRRTLEVARIVEERRTRDAPLPRADHEVLRISIVAVSAALAEGLAHRRVSEIVDAALDTVPQIRDPKLQARGLAVIAPLMSDELLDGALAVAASIGDAQSRSDATAALVDRVAALRGVRASLPLALAIPERGARRRALVAVAAHARDLAEPELLCCWQLGADGQDVARGLSARARADVLCGIGALLDVVLRLAPAPADEVAAAIDDAVAWWPP